MPTTADYPLAARILGWGVAVFYTATSILTAIMPRVAKELPLRGELRDLHMWIGLGLLLLVSARLVLWFRQGAVTAPPKLPRSVHAQARLLTLTVYLLLLLGALLGIAVAWGGGHQPPLIPMMFENNQALWMFAGYFHSAFGFAQLLLNISIIVLTIYAVFRYGVGWFQASPEPILLQSLGGLASTVYALVNTGPSRLPGVEILLALALIVWGLSILRRRAPRSAATKAES